jgi:hypothetical protein
MSEANLYVAAWKKFKESDRFNQLSEPSLLRQSDFKQYLENRLLEAFSLGWNARSALGKGADHG